jgi:hypothetical protein
MAFGDSMVRLSLGITLGAADVRARGTFPPLLPGDQVDSFTLVYGTSGFFDVSTVNPTVTIRVSAGDDLIGDENGGAAQADAFDNLPEKIIAATVIPAEVTAITADPTGRAYLNVRIPALYFPTLTTRRVTVDLEATAVGLAAVFMTVFRRPPDKK